MRRDPLTLLALGLVLISAAYTISLSRSSRAELRHLEIEQTPPRDPQPSHEFASPEFGLTTNALQGVAEALIVVHEELRIIASKLPDASTGLALDEASSETPIGASIRTVGVAYSGFDALPPDMQERVLPFFFGEPPGPGVLDAIYVSDTGWGASMSSPPLETEAERAMARVAVQLHSENMDLQAEFIQERLAADEYLAFRSNEDALQAAKDFKMPVVQQPEPGLFALIDLQPLIDTRPDFALRASIHDRIVRDFGQRNHASLHATWEDAPGGQ